METNVLYSTIERVLEYVEDNLKSSITLEDISKHVSFSKFHLDRVFRAFSSTSLMSYVKGRKLTCSAMDLLNTNLKVSDISEEYGFNYEQSYIRAFENAFGITPGGFRKQKAVLEVRDKLSMEYLKAIGENGLAFDPSIVIIPEFYITGPRYRILEADDKLYREANAKGNDFYSNQRHNIENALDNDIYIGYVEHVPGNYSHANEMRGSLSYNYYMPSLRVSGPEYIPPDMTCIRVPTNKYALFKYIGLHHPMHINVNNLTGIFDYVFGEWFPKSGYSTAIPYHFERLDLKDIRDDFCEMELYIPLLLKP